MMVDATVKGLKTQIYLTKSEAHSCSETSVGWRCIRIKEADDLKKRLQTNFMGNSYESYNVKRLGKRTFAGISAQCYGVESTYDNTYLEYCYSSDNVPLYMKKRLDERGARATELIATSYSTSVPDSVFELPA
ncbi:MAG: hypothetical protein KAJ24_01325 [Candidatus Aenigmarchaeota archaeon]|nr:hypothetical protein [Candidatus Aenigmarchaeota archaeon]